MKGIDVRNITPDDEKLLRPAIDLTYGDIEEGVDRAKLTMNLLAMHISAIAQLIWDTKIQAHPEVYEFASRDFLAYEITSIMFTVYNDLLKLLPEIMQEQINGYVERDVFGLVSKED